eukprot:3763974-Pyramimonas_sp.AAC.1
MTKLTSQPQRCAAHVVTAKQRPLARTLRRKRSGPMAAAAAGGRILLSIVHMTVSTTTATSQPET